VTLPLAERLSCGFTAVMPDRASTRATVELAERLGFDSLWVGDHIAFPVPMLDPLLQLAQAAAYSERLLLGTAVYLLPLRHATPVAKQVATLDHLCDGRLIFGVGVGGEFPREYEACGVPVAERGARLSEAIPLLWRFERRAGHERRPLLPVPENRPPRPAQKDGRRLVRRATQGA
jgi:alkanesulfonate monooxygenase SsuD/methylene tetrahydromethanopterin reductase-like flavin-dependent oxidoreductase (luciferase family)